MKIIIKEWTAGRNKITVYAYPNRSNKADVSFKDKDGKVHTGRFSFANQVRSMNTNITHDQQEFNSIKAALKNLKSLKKAMELWNQ